jgi:hypothetical protein
VRLYSRQGNDLTKRFPLIVEAMAQLPSCTIDGEVVACDDSGVPSFDLLRHRQRDDHVCLYAFDLIKLVGGDLRREPLKQRKADLRQLLADAGPGPQLNGWIDGGDFDGATVVRARLQTRRRRHRVEAQGLALCLGTIAVLAQDEEPGERGGAAGSRGGLGPLKAITGASVVFRACTH